jgi:pimeloyl-ACP methyl ester carboxylesterase
MVDDAKRATLGQYPQLGKAAAKAIPQGKLVLLDGVGHLPHIETYDRFIQPLLDFLDK